MKKASFAERFRYWFDNIMARGPAAMIGLLALLTTVIILLASGIMVAAGLVPELTFDRIIWMNLMHALDSGTIGGTKGSWPFLLVMLVVTLGGIFVTSTLIGVLTTGIRAKLDDLRIGRSRVIERDHTVILGWSEQVFTIVSELVEANANRKRACIVILANKDKVEMEDALRDRIPDTRTTRLVCRSGSPMEMQDLEIPSLQTARAIIVLSPDSDDPDAEVIKTLLAITNNPRRRSEPYHIVAEIRDPKNVEAARLVGRDEVEIVLVSQLIARIIAQTCRQSGLSVVYNELLDFAGDEIYFQEEPGLVGRTFGQALLAYEDSAVMGLCRNGTPWLNPPMDTPIIPGDQVIAISEDDDTIRLSGLREVGIAEEHILCGDRQPQLAEHTLILGWNWRAPEVIRELDNYVAPGSEVLVVADDPAAEAAVAQCCPELKNQKVSFRFGDTTERRTLDQLNVPGFDHIVLLCYSDLLDAQRADARTIVTLLHLRDIARQAGRAVPIVSEMRDMRNRALAEVAEADDYIVSDRLVSLMMAQVAENKALNAVLSDIFDPEGCEIYLKPVARYVRPGVPLSFYTVVEAARRLREVALGYRLTAQAHNAARSYGVVINPDKSQQVTFAEGDKIIVLAES